MGMQNLTRQEREALYIKRATELQKHWGNPISPEDFDDIGELTDKQLDMLTNDAVGQMKFERWCSRIAGLISFVIKTFIFLGIAGLLLFGLKQLF